MAEFQPKQSSWLSVREAVSFHHQHTPAKRPVHRSSVYRWIQSGRVHGRYSGGSLYVSRKSLRDFCTGRSARRMQAPLPSIDRNGIEAANRLRVRHGLPFEEDER